jgi:hypothetical protein
VSRANNWGSDECAAAATAELDKQLEQCLVAVVAGSETDLARLQPGGVREAMTAYGPAWWRTHQIPESATLRDAAEDHQPFNQQVSAGSAPSRSSLTSWSLVDQECG